MPLDQVFSSVIPCLPSGLHPPSAEITSLELILLSSAFLPRMVGILTPVLRFVKGEHFIDCNLSPTPLAKYTKYLPLVPGIPNQSLSAAVVKKGRRWEGSVSMLINFHNDTQIVLPSPGTAIDSCLGPGISSLQTAENSLVKFALP